ncbi:MAG: VanZ family protein [Nitrospirales bacterium]|nr:VanZ family protein [Nitrospira sp.]MDR4502691.1 VanZ family protein [Nitrospirales bacterium]
MSRVKKHKTKFNTMLPVVERSVGRPSFLSQQLPMTRIMTYWMPVVLYAGLIVFLSSLSSTGMKIPSLFYGYDDKIIHAIEYAILAMLCYRAYLGTFVERLAMYAPVLAIVTAVLFGVTDEIHQAFVPLRHADVWDLVADAVGSFLGVAAWKWYMKISALES